ncbi:MAG: 50S ribosomal protein L23 [bacterium]
MALFNKKTKEEKSQTPIKDVVKSGQKTVVNKKSQTNKQKAEWIYDIIKKPHITEKAVILSEKGKYVFNVSYQATKPEIKKAIKALYDVKINKVNLIHMPAKRRRLGATKGWQHGLEKGYKKAIVTLAKGEKIDVISS